MNSRDDYPQARYVPLAKPDTDASDYDEPSEKPSHTTLPWRLFRASAVALLAIACLVAGFLGNELIRRRGLFSNGKLSCESVSTRMEWRSLSNDEKHEYIDAVRCLTATPSKQLPQDTLYDDFSYVHIDTGEDAYNSAVFLPYHRYLLHVYESELKLSCGYKGSLPYWDWTLDWENLSASPVFSNTTGFGNIVDSSLTDNHCVQDGPLSDLVLPFYDNLKHPNCIWRALSGSASEQGNVLSKDRLHPSAVQALLAQQKYPDFIAELEKGPHVHIPNGIEGDFMEFTAANDPLFFLHHRCVLLVFCLWGEQSGNADDSDHSQLDRIWWMWQQAKSGARLQEYNGKKRSNETNSGTVSLSDIVSLGVLAPEVKVADIIDTEGHLLCYKY